MPERVIKEDEISVNATRFKLSGRVHRQPTSQYAPKIVIGDTNKDSLGRSSTITWNDFRAGGLLSLINDFNSEINRFWFSTANGRHRGHLVLDDLITVTATASLSGAVTAIGELNDEIYAAYSGGVDVRKFDNSGDSWGASLHTLPDAAIQMLQIFLGGTEYLVISTFDGSGTGYTYTSDGSAFTDDTKDTKYLTFWDDRLWGISNTGQLWWALTIGTEVDDAQLQLPTGYITSLFTGPDAGGEEIIYAATKEGLYAHDAANARFVKTGLQHPRHEQAGLFATEWNSLIYVPHGMGVFEYSPQSGSIRNIGLDQDDGLLAAYRGRIERLIPTFTGLLAVVNSATNRAVWLFNGVGWHFQTLLLSNDISSAYVGNAYSTYRLWYGSDGTVGAGAVRHQQLEVDSVNPNEDAARTYGPGDISGTIFSHDLPWFDAGQPEANKVALRLNIEVQDASADEAVRVFFALNYSTSFTTLATITSDGTTTLTFPDNAAPFVGSEFRQIQIRIAMDRGATTTNSPDVLSISLEYRKKQPAKWGFTFDIDHSDDYAINTPEQQLALLRTASESNTLVELTYRNRDDDEENYYVDITGMEIVEQTGNVFEGVTRMQATEL